MVWIKTSLMFTLIVNSFLVFTKKGNANFQTLRGESNEFEALSTGCPVPCTLNPLKMQCSYLRVQKIPIDSYNNTILFFGEMFWFMNKTLIRC